MSPRQAQIAELEQLVRSLNEEYKSLPDRAPRRGELNRRIQAARAEARRLGRRGAMA